MRTITKILSIILIIILCILEFFFRECIIDSFVFICGLMLATTGFVFSIKKKDKNENEEISIEDTF